MGGFADSPLKRPSPITVAWPASGFGTSGDAKQTKFKSNFTYCSHE